jgi:hypothetical protein
MNDMSNMIVSTPSVTFLSEDPVSITALEEELDFHSAASTPPHFGNDMSNMIVSTPSVTFLPDDPLSITALAEELGFHSAASTPPRVGNGMYDHFRRSYDSRYLDNLPEDEQNILRTMSEAVRGDYTIHSTLTRLAANHYYGNMPVAEYITGPKTLSLQTSNEFGKRIYIFGESHRQGDTCEELGYQSESIITYLAKLFETTDVFIDFYLEIRSYTGYEWSESTWQEIYENDSIISNIAVRFADCIQASSRHNRECQLVRAHYLDIRESEGETPNDSEQIINLIEKGAPQNRLSVEDAQELYSLLTELLSYDSFADYCISDFHNTSPVNRQLMKVDPEMREKMITFFDDQIRKAAIPFESNYRARFQIARQIAMDNTQNIRPKFRMGYRSLGDIVRVLAIALSPIMDVYTIARIFRDFDLTKSHTSTTRIWDQPRSPNNIIIYVGNNHAVQIRQFLAEIGFEPISEIGDGNVPSKCLVMEDFPQPLFTSTI